MNGMTWDSCAHRAAGARYCNARLSSWPNKWGFRGFCGQADRSPLRRHHGTVSLHPGGKLARAEAPHPGPPGGRQERHRCGRCQAVCQVPHARGGHPFILRRVCVCGAPGTVTGPRPCEACSRGRTSVSFPAGIHSSFWHQAPWHPWGAPSPDAPRWDRSVTKDQPSRVHIWLSEWTVQERERAQAIVSS